jgi:membrane protein YqaA with SNARE-associated domain
MGLAEHRHANWALAGISFAESSFFLIPPDALLIPMVLARRDKAYFIAAICTAASVAGGMLGYLIGAVLYETVGAWLVNIYGYTEQAEQLREMYQSEWGTYFVFIGGLTPIPYKLVTIASGMAKYNLPMFFLISAVTRGTRFFIEAWLLRTFGEPIRDFIEKRLEWVVTAATVLLIGGFIALKYL